jgi:SAM-dependent MidA family methyltransferase
VRLAAVAAARYPAKGDYASEINPAAEALVGEVDRRMTGGASLWVDYGFSRRGVLPSAARALMVHYRHRVHDDRLAELSDIPAHVDFTEWRTPENGRDSPSRVSRRRRPS